MSDDDPQERHVRAARNQSMFRAINEKVRELNDTFSTLTGTHAIACECADVGCIETLEIASDEYEAIRKVPNHFAVLPEHVYPDVESVVKETDGYVVVEKIATASQVATALDPRGD